jgi:hypothetical protein
VTLPVTSTILVDGTGTPVELTLLLDPGACIHATIGIVPARGLVLPPDVLTRVLGRMSVTFLTAPVLCAAGVAALPIPKESNGEWSWVTHGPSGWQTLPAVKANPGQTQSYSPQTLMEGWLMLKRPPMS